MPQSYLQNYNGKSESEFDPVILEKRKSFLPFQIGCDAYLKAEACTTRALYEEARDYGIGEFFGVPIHSTGAWGMFAVLNAGDLGCVLAPGSDTYNRIVAFAHFVHGYALTKTAMPRPINRPRQLEDQERVCLHWTRLGKTSWEISRIIGCSQRTVDHHLRRAMNKLDAANRTHAVAVAIHQGLI